MARQTAVMLIVVVASVAVATIAYVLLGQQPNSESYSANGAYDGALAACGSLPNDSIQYETETDRTFINLPKGLYRIENIGGNFKTVKGNATAGYISNGGLPGEGLQATPRCWSTYYEFNGTGEVDLTVPGATSSVPDYFVRFVVSSNANDAANAKTPQG